MDETRYETCTCCGRSFRQEQLTRKQVRFFRNAEPRRQLKAITVAKLCSDCLEEDSEWNAEPSFGPPEGPRLP